MTVSYFGLPDRCVDRCTHDRHKVTDNIIARQYCVQESGQGGAINA